MKKLKSKTTTLTISILLSIFATTFYSCSKDESISETSNKSEVQEKITAIAHKYGVKVLSFSDNIENPTYQTKDLAELDSLLKNLTATRQYSSKLKTTKTGEITEFSNTPTTNIQRIKLRSIEAGSVNDNKSTNCSGVNIHISLSWNSETDAGSLSTYIYGTLAGGSSYTQNSSWTNRKDKYTIEFSSSGVYAYEVKISDTESVKFAFSITTQGEINTPLEFATWRVGQ